MPKIARVGFEITQRIDLWTFDNFYLSNELLQTKNILDLILSQCRILSLQAVCIKIPWNIYRCFGGHMA